jgi:hypothetical protein
MVHLVVQTQGIKVQNRKILRSIIRPIVRILLLKLHHALRVIPLQWHDILGRVHPVLLHA